MDGILQWGLEVVRQVQTLGPAFSAPMKLFTFLGQEEFFLLLMPLLFWCLDRSVGVHVAYLLVLSASLNGLVKGFLYQPRPFWLDAAVRAAEESSFGLPSGHAQNSAVIWSYLAFRARAAWVWIAALVLIALISLSRIYLGVHFPTDILGGWLIAALLLAGYIAWQPRLCAWLAARGLGAQIAAAALSAAAFPALYGLGLLAAPPGPPAYDAAFLNTALAEARNSAWSAAGMLLGGGLGLALERHYVRFRSDGQWWQYAARYVVGVVVVVALWAGLKAIFPTEPAALGMALRLVRYTLMILWVTFLWPWAFVRMGLAERQ